MSDYGEGQQLLGLRWREHLRAAELRASMASVWHVSSTIGGDGAASVEEGGKVVITGAATAATGASMDERPA